MKTQVNFKRTILNVLLTALFFTTSVGLFAQEKESSNLKDFKITVQKADKAILMQSREGSAWTELKFTLSDQPQAVNAYGVQQLNKVTSNKDIRLTNFLFTVSKAENGVQLKGIDGTAWTELSFSMAEDKKYSIDQTGFTILN